MKTHTCFGRNRPERVEVSSSLHRDGKPMWAVRYKMGGAILTGIDNCPWCGVCLEGRLLSAPEGVQQDETPTAEVSPCDISGASPLPDFNAKVPAEPR